MFSEEYDRSLKYILCANDNKGNIIECFVHEIMLYLGERIKSDISKYKDDMIMKNSGISLSDYELRDEICVADKVIYWYHIDYITGILTLGKCRKKDDYITDDVQLFLENIDASNYCMMRNYDLIPVGEFAYNFKEEIVPQVGEVLEELDSTTYQLMKTAFGEVVVYDCYERLKAKRGYRKLPLKDNVFYKKKGRFLRHRNSI